MQFTDEFLLMKNKNCSDNDPQKPTSYDCSFEWVIDNQKNDDCYKYKFNEPTDL